MLGAGALGRPRGMVWGGRREEGSGWGTHVYLWRIHFGQNQYNIVKFKNKIKFKKKGGGGRKVIPVRKKKKFKRFSGIFGKSIKCITLYIMGDPEERREKGAETILDR